MRLAVLTASRWSSALTGWHAVVAALLPHRAHLPRLAQNDFLGGLPMRAGLVYGEARRVGGGGRCQPCGRSDGPAASRAASRGCVL